MVKLNSLPGYTLAVVHEEFVPALRTVADIYESALVPFEQVHTDGTRIKMYFMRQSVAMTAQALGAINLELPFFIVGETLFYAGRRGMLFLGASVNPEYGYIESTPVADILFTSIDVDAEQPHYVDDKGVAFRAQIIQEYDVTEAA
jgi:hypothetical protein